MPCFLLPGTRHSVMPRRDISPPPSPAQDNSIVGRSIRGRRRSDQRIISVTRLHLISYTYTVLFTGWWQSVYNENCSRTQRQYSRQDAVVSWHYLYGMEVVCNAFIYYWARGGYCIISQLNTNDNSLLLIYLITQCNALILMQRYNGTAWSFRRL